MCPVLKLSHFLGGCLPKHFVVEHCTKMEKFTIETKVQLNNVTHTQTYKSSSCRISKKLFPPDYFLAAS